APIPVLRILRESAMLGGVGNVVRNLAALGASARLVSVTGGDSAGADIEQLLMAQTGVVPQLLTDGARPTTLKTRFIADAQQLLRADHEETLPITAALAAKIRAVAESAMTDCGALILSDYGKGVLDDATLRALIEAARKADRPIVVDPKGHDYNCYAGADLVTPNRKELQQATRMPVESDDQVVAAARALARRCDLKAVLVTRGAAGMCVAPAHGDATHLPALAREVYDVSGAGDTVVAVVAACLATGVSLVDAARLANVAAGVVVGKTGTAIVETGELRHALQGVEGAKPMSREALLAQCRRWRERGLKIGFTNGCFDLIHPGHAALLRRARAACDRLVVGLNSDASVQRLKGPTRPLQNQQARSEVIASLASVDAVTVFDEDTPLQLIEAMRPELLVKGADYRIDEVVGADIVQGYGGQVLLVPIEQGHSTTATIARMTD
ncbi:MAG: D-glycero-beta-D-manno-heptose 1-phosphate adenylyltransferase, partial [Alphaproteobacteria bacterium]